MENKTSFSSWPYYDREEISAVEKYCGLEKLISGQARRLLLLKKNMPVI